MTFSDDSGGSARPPVWSDWRRRYFPKRYILSWIMAALLPFILLRLLFMSEIAFPFQSSAVSSPPSSLLPEENVSHGQSPIIFASSLAPAPGPEDAKSKTTIPESPPLIRPDEDAWITHDDWIKHDLNRTEEDKFIPDRFENSTEFMKDFSPVSGNGENFGLPEDNEKEQLEFEATEMTEKDKKKGEEDKTATEENSQHEKSQEEEKIKDEEKKHVEVNEENAQQEKRSEEGEKIKDEEHIQAKENRNPEGQPEQADEQRGAKERQSNVEEKAAQDTEAEPKGNFEEQERERGEAQAKEAEVPRNFEEKERINVTEHKSAVAPESNFGKQPKGGADEAQAEQKDAEPAEQVDKQEDKQQRDRGQTDKETPAGECDLFEGVWEHDTEGPLYTNTTCFYIQEAQNCMSNGRPDTEYLYWRWKPWGCDLPRFDAKSFLDKFRGKAIGFIGDSIARNQMQSLLCLLSQVEIPIMTYESADDKTVWWLYKEHLVKLAVVWSPYLLKESEEGERGFEKGQSLLYLDVLDTAWTSVMQDFDIMVFLTGQWYYKGSVYIKQEKVIGCHDCTGLNVTEIGYHEAYRAAIREVLGMVSNEYKGITLMSTFPLSHFENGTWDTGGYCKRERPLQPLESAQFPGLNMDNKMHDIVIEEFNGVVKENRELNKEAHLEILDVTKVSLQRADGHPGPFRRPHPEKGRDPNVYYPNDCLHWCLPGPIEAWNQLVVKIVDKYL